MVEREFGSPFSRSLELFFLSSRLVRALKRAPQGNTTEDDRWLFRTGAQFFSQALKGANGIDTLRVTSRAAEEARTYGWGITALASLARSESNIGERIKTASDIKDVFVTFHDLLQRLQETDPDRGTVDREQVDELRGFFDCMRQVARESDIKPVDDVLIVGK